MATSQKGAVNNSDVTLNCPYVHIKNACGANKYLTHFLQEHSAGVGSPSEDRRLWPDEGTAKQSRALRHAGASKGSLRMVGGLNGTESCTWVLFIDGYERF